MYAILCALLLAEAVPEPGPPDVKPAASATWDHSTLFHDTGDTRLLVLRSAAELVAATPYADRDALPMVVEKQATEHLAKVLKVKDVDWANQMVLVISHRKMTTGGYRVEVPDLKRKGKDLVVSWKLHPPKGAAPDVLTRPGLALLVPRHAGTVKFDPPAKKK